MDGNRMKTLVNKWGWRRSTPELKANSSLGINCSSQHEERPTELLPLTTRKQLLNPHRDDQVSKSTHLCITTAHNNKQHRPDESSTWQSWGGQQAHILRTWKERRGEQNKNWRLTCRWWPDLKGSHSCSHNFSCHNTGFSGSGRKQMWQSKTGSSEAF